MVYPMRKRGHGPKSQGDGRSSTKGAAFMSTIFFGTVILMLLALMTTMTNQNVWSRQIMVSYAKKIDKSDVVLERATSGVSTSGNVTISGHSKKKKRADKRISTTKSGRKEPQPNSIRSRDETNTATRTRKSKLDTTNDPPDSAVSWLISFPNSGTTYTIHNTEHVSMRSTATNYLSEVHFARSDRIPVKAKADNIANGPWQRNNSLPMPPVVLTKTHCTGYDDRAPMQSSIISTQRFLDGCKRTSQYADLSDLTNHSKVKTAYDHKIVASAIHLIRNPFDNIISRMHHGMKTRHKALGSTDDETRAFMTSREGVMSWCEIADRTFWMESEVPKNITNRNKLKRKPWDLNILLPLPCHSELFRYVEWHNAALRMIEQENLRSMVVYYEDYETHYNATVNSILKFLDLAYEGEDPLPFKAGKTYRDTFFTQEVQEKTREALQVMASKELWQILRKYFPSTSAADK